METIESNITSLVDPKLPQWWTPVIAASWQRSREAALSDWHARGDRSTPVEMSIAEHALAFGHGARSAYPASPRWDAVAATLHADWTRLGNTGAAAWDRVAGIVRHEWARAAGPGGDAAPEPIAM